MYPGRNPGNCLTYPSDRSLLRGVYMFFWDPGDACPSLLPQRGFFIRREQELRAEHLSKMRRGEKYPGQSGA
jgi:hypothetical protein